MACEEVDRYYSQHFASFSSSAHCESAGEAKRIFVSFHSKTDLDSYTSAAIDDLKGLHFYLYNPITAKQDEITCSVFVTNIPLFVKEPTIRGTFAQYRNIKKFQLKLHGHYQNATIVYDDTQASTFFVDTWAVMCRDYCLRVVSASITNKFTNYINSLL